MKSNNINTPTDSVVTFIKILANNLKAKRNFCVFKQLSLTSNQLILLTCCYITFLFNAPFLLKAITAITALENYSIFFLLSVPLFLLSLTLVLQSAIAFKWLTKPTLMITIICSALIFYGYVTYGIVFDYGMIQNAVETDSAEALSYVNVYAVLFFFFLGVLPVLFIYHVKLIEQSFAKSILSRLKLLGFSVIVIALIASLFYSDYAAVGRNNKQLLGYITPYKMMDSSYKYLKENYFYPPLSFKIIDIKPDIIRKSNRTHVTVMVVGETARADKFSLNGYNKPTNQYTEKQGVVSFTQMTSCGTATAVSVPCMFSRLNKSNYNKRSATAQQNVIDIIHLAGADVLWISNNNGSCKGVCARVKTKQLDTSNSKPLCDGKYCYDEALLTPLREKLSNLTQDNTLIVLHLIGSHGPTYYRRYPESRRLFTPDCRRSDIHNCTAEQLVNTYDNTIAYTDFVLSEVINELSTLSEKSNVETSMLYVSDHGESLGEGGVYLHGLPYVFAPESQTHIPMLYWSDSTESDFSLQCLNDIKDKEFTHDNVFDTLLSLMSVRSKTYNADNDAFIHCKAKSAIARTVMSPIITEI